ncbi:MAG: thiamine pyrophosphate-binding protein, partial [Bacteroidaceae bacterium]
ALGLAQAVGRPGAVCVTSGSALLNTLPAVAEAYYQGVPLLIISADRPTAWIGQLDGQTLPQVGALGKFVSRCVHLPEPTNNEDKWYCNRLINDALLSLHQNHTPVHINVPISEPLFCFNTPQLPIERVMRSYALPLEARLPSEIIEKLNHAHQPLLIIGQLPPQDEALRAALLRLDEEYKILVLPELLSNLSPAERMAMIEHAIPDCLRNTDYVIYVGGTLVGKELKKMLRQLPSVEVLRITERDEEFSDTFCHSTQFLYAPVKQALLALCSALNSISSKESVKTLRTLLRPIAPVHTSFTYDAFHRIVESINALPPNRVVLHLANSSVVRLAARILHNPFYPVFCNRGVNGIEGSLSTAAGYSIGTSRITICFIGDLSFFYDANALWNHNLRSNLRIVLINNGCGDIFHHLAGLEQSPALHSLVAATHTTTACGIAATYGIHYFPVSNLKDLDAVLPQFLGDATVPQLLELFTK